MSVKNGRQYRFTDVVSRVVRLIFLDEATTGQAPQYQSHLMTNGSVVSESEKRLSLVFEDLSDFPFSLVKKYSTWIHMVDLSHNKFTDVRFLEHFDALDAVILDHNLLSSASTFPRIPSLKTLWLNYNRLEDLTTFLETLSTKCPNLVFLSLMGNDGVPSSLNGAPTPTISRYRVQVLGYFPKLRYLDDAPITQLEVDTAQQIRESRKMSVSQMLGTISSFVESKLDLRPGAARTSHNKVV